MYYLSLEKYVLHVYVLILHKYVFICVFCSMFVFAARHMIYADIHPLSSAHMRRCVCGVPEVLVQSGPCLEHGAHLLSLCIRASIFKHLRLVSKHGRAHRARQYLLPSSSILGGPGTFNSVLIILTSQLQAG